MDPSKVAALECLLFVAREPVPPERLAQVLNLSLTELEAALEGLRQALEGRGLQILTIAGGYRLGTRPEYAEVVEAFLTPPPTRLSDSALETLAIVAYRQPITRPEIEAIRGVSSHATLQTLLERGLVIIQGRKPAPGRPLQYGTTQKFLDHFGLHDLSDLPELGEDLKLEPPAVFSRKLDPASGAPGGSQAPF